MYTKYLIRLFDGTDYFYNKPTALEFRFDLELSWEFSPLHVFRVHGKMFRHFHQWANYNSEDPTRYLSANTPPAENNNFVNFF